MKAFIEESKESTQSRAEKGGAKCRDKATEDSDFLLSHFLLKEDRKKLKVEKEGSDVYEQNEPQIEKADQGEIPLSIGVLRWERNRWYSASSRRIQFHRVHVGDSGAVVTPFVQVATYATRNFATLGQLELLPPFTGLPFKAYNTSPSDFPAPGRFRGKPAISDLGWPFTPSHKSSPYFATYVGSVLQGLLELSSTCSWLDRSVSGQIGRTRRFHLWKAPTPNGLSRCSHFLADPSCKRYAVRVSALD
ncbi:hypothetical protein L1887_61563 [Cichorium endivia]|nr:hypothetical protein L1887_61563 [Cichorium endivia]